MKLLDDVLMSKLAKKCSKNTVDLYSKIHRMIIGLSPRNVNYDIFPIYITYYNIKADKVFALIYLNKDYLDVGVSLGKKHKYTEAKSAKYMKYPGITKYIRIKTSRNIKNSTKEILKDSYSIIDSSEDD